ncbi:hypothetical protein [Mycobacterium sp. IS-3022]|uniref:hypothetical protein n=1 Tax=Mycobacterium sp. IS-3022 TaxID=1772277 RepID=UPI0007416BEF|nr:hypothetical protein [Mycobacterium sp. IS-3022]KUI04454.1 hypothetical protein AU188_03940 [Mycobacterium sp. IS-3022]
MTMNTTTAFLMSDDEESDPNEYFAMTGDIDTAREALEEMLGDDFYVTTPVWTLLDGIDPDPNVRVYNVSDLAIVYVA